MHSYVSRATLTPLIEPNIVSNGSRAQVRSSKARPAGIARLSRLSKKIRYALKVVDGSKINIPKEYQDDKIEQLGSDNVFPVVLGFVEQLSSRSNNQAQRWLQRDQWRSTAGVGRQGSRHFSEEWPGRTARLLHRWDDGGHGPDFGWNTPPPKGGGSREFNIVRWRP